MRLSLSLWLAFPAFAATPVIFFTDLDSGPKTGGENNKGAYVTIVGKNFGATRGSSTVAVGGGLVDNYPVWTDTKISFQLGANPVTGNIVVTTSAGASNGIAFTIRTATIYFVATTGNDSNDGSVGSPWRHLSKFRDVATGGQILYVRGGTYTESGENSSGNIFYVSPSFPWAGAGSTGNPHVISGYPGETVTFQSAAGGSIINYVPDTAASVQSSNIVFANFIWDSNNHNSTIGWRGVANGASPTNRVRNIKFVNLEVKNYLLASGGGGGAELLGVGADGPLDNIQMYGNHVHDVTTFDSLDHIMYMSAGGVGYDIGWNTIHGIYGTDGSHYPGYCLQIYTGGSANYADFTQVKVHDNVMYDCNGRGGLNIADRVKDALIYNNIIYGAEGNALYGGFILRLQQQGGDCTSSVYNNTLVTDSATSHLDAMLDLSFTGNIFTFRNNIFLTNGNSIAYSFNNNGSPTMVASHNLFYGSGAVPSWAAGELNVDPLLVNRAGRDFHLQSGSPAKNAGTALLYATPDPDGVTRPQGAAVDLGAFEYVEGSVGRVVGVGKLTFSGKFVAQ